MELLANPVRSAKEAGLRYVSDSSPGIHRIPNGDAFVYLDSDNLVIKDQDILARIKSLAIPPAWTDVWICAIANGHLQATGKDAKGRKQYRYHPRWREIRDETKFDRMIAFGQALPKIRKQVEQDLAEPGLTRRKVLATIVRLLETTLIRVGNEEYARENNSYGLTTMQDQHATVSSSKIEFKFKGKRGIRHNVSINDDKLARIVRKCQDLPGQELFQYLDENREQKSVNSTDVNEYLKEITGEDFTAKDFRTWAGTVLAGVALQELEDFDTKTQAKRNVVQAIESVAQRLGNTATICKKCYVHPAIVNSYMEKNLILILKQKAESELKEGLAGLRPEEAAILAFLQQRLEQEARNARKGENLVALLKNSVKKEGKRKLRTPA